MRKLYYGFITFLYVFILSKMGSGYSWEELFDRLLNRVPTEIFSIAFSLLIAFIVYILTKDEARKISVSQILAIVFLAFLIYRSVIDDIELNNKRTYQIIDSLTENYKIENRLLYDLNSNKLIDGEILTFKKNSKKIEYQLFFKNGRVLDGFKYDYSGNKTKLTNAHIYNMGLKYE